MKLNLHILQADLGDYCPSSSIHADDRLTLLGVRFLAHCPGAPSPDYLYLATASELCHHPFSSQLQQCAIVGEAPHIPFFTAQALYLDPSLSAQEAFLMLQDLFDRYNRWEAQLMEIATGSGDIYRLMNLGAEILGNPMALFDTNMSCMAIGDRENVPPDDPVWKDVLHSSHATLDLFPALRNNRKTLAEVVTSRHAFLYEFPKLQKACLHCNLFRGSTKIGCICMTENLVPLTRRTTSLINHFRLFVITAMEHSSVITDAAPGFKQLVRRYLKNETMESQHLDFVLGKFGWVSRDFYQVIVCAPTSPITDENLSYARSHFQRQLPGCFVMEYEKRLLIVRNLPSDTEDVLPEKLEHTLLQMDYCCGISPSAVGFNEIANSYRKACTAFLVGSSMRPEDRIHNYQDLILEYSLQLIQRQVAPDDLCHPLIKKLAHYEEQTDMPYIQTLYTYLCCGRSLVETAKQLFIHRNTLVYRLNKIEDIIGNKAFSDFQNTLPFLFSCWLHQNNRAP